MPRLYELLQDRNMYSVDASQSVLEVARVMSECRVGAILVLQGGRLCGIFSERDLMTRVVAAGLTPSEVAVSEVMTPKPATIESMATVEDAMERMRALQCRHLPVVDGATVLGLISMRDLMNLALEEKSDEIAHMRSYIQGVA